MNLDSANRSKEFVLVAVTDELGRATKAYCPGHACKRYRIDIERDTLGLQCQCHEVNHFDKKSGTFVDQESECAGAQFGVCHHILAVVLSTTEKAGQLEFFDSKPTTQKEGTRLIRIQTASCQKKAVWVVFTPKAKPQRQPAARKPIKKAVVHSPQSDSDERGLENLPPEAFEFPPVAEPPAKDDEKRLTLYKEESEGPYSKRKSL